MKSDIEQHCDYEKLRRSIVSKKVTRLRTSENVIQIDDLETRWDDNDSGHGSLTLEENISCLCLDYPSETAYSDPKKRRVNTVEDHVSDTKRSSDYTSKINTLEPKAREEAEDWENIQLSKAIAQQDKDGDNLLFIAIICRHTKLVFLLLDMITDYRYIRVANKLRQTALHLAVLTDNDKVTRRLMVAGVEVEKQDRNGNTPLHIAVQRGCKTVVKCLLSPITYIETKENKYTIPYQPVPQNMKTRNYKGETCLLIAVLRRRTDIIDMLLDVNADINTIDMKTGKTCLHIAAELGDVSLVKHLLSKSGVSVDRKTYSGCTAAEHAYYRGHYNIVFVLQCHGASRPRTLDEIEGNESGDELH